MSLESPKALPPSLRQGFLTLTVLFSITTLILLVVGFRLSQRGHWTPTLPADFGQWEGAEKTPSVVTVNQLGGAHTLGYVYSNLFNETVDVHVIATSSFESYLDPRSAMGAFRFGMTAQKPLPLFGAEGTVRTLIFRNPDTQGRLLMYYWVQFKNGKAHPGDTLTQGTDILPRLRLGASSVLEGTESCVVRAYTDISPLDRDGAQARRNMDEVCLAIHQHLKAQGQAPVARKAQKP